MIPLNHDEQLPRLAPGPRVPIVGESVAASRPKKSSTACQSCKQAKRKVGNVIPSVRRLLVLLQETLPTNVQCFSESS